MRPKNIRNIGIALFVISFLAPARLRQGEDSHFFGGFGAFYETPLFAFQAILANRYEAPSHPILLFMLMMGAWIANFSIFKRLPPILGLIAIFLPWPAYIFLFSVLAGFVPFYPWAVGIALIHLSRFAPATESLQATAAVPVCLVSSDP
jgi:hypothetical protein